MNSIKSLTDNSRHFEQGEVVYCEEDGKNYIRGEDSWIKSEVNGSNIELSILDINKQICSQLPNLNQAGLQKLKDELNVWRNGAKFFLLYGKEINYFTLFQGIKDEKEFGGFGGTVVELLKSLGNIITYEPIEGAYEIWLRQEENEPVCFYLMDWTEGVVNYCE